VWFGEEIDRTKPGSPFEFRAADSIAAGCYRYTIDTLTEC